MTQQDLRVQYQHETGTTPSGKQSLYYGYNDKEYTPEYVEWLEEKLLEETRPRRIR